MVSAMRYLAFGAAWSCLAVAVGQEPDRDAGQDEAAKAAQRVRQSLKEWEEAVRASDTDSARAACAASSELGRAAVPALVDVLETETSALGRYHAVAVLHAIGPRAKDAIPAVSKVLQDQEPDLRIAALRCLNKIDPAWPAKSVPAIQEALADPEARVRQEAAYLLGSAGAAAKAAAPLLIEVLKKDTSISCRQHAVSSLALIAPESPEVIHALIEALNDEYTVSCAARGLAVAGANASAAVAPLCEVVKAEQQTTAAVSGGAEEAIVALGSIGPGAREAVPLLVDVLNGKVDFLAADAAVALGRIGVSSAAVLGALTHSLARHESEDVRADCALALGHLGKASDETVTALTEALIRDQTRVSVNAASALGRVRPQSKRALDALRSALGDCRAEVRDAARRALEANMEKKGP